MPARPRTRPYVEPSDAPGELHPVIVEYLLTGASGGRDAPREVRMIPYQWDRACRLWRKHRASLIREARRRRITPFFMDAHEGKQLASFPVCAPPGEPDPRWILAGDGPPAA